MIKLFRSYILNKEIIPYVIFFIITLGVVFCKFGGLLYPEVKSKWYWLYVSVSIGSLILLASGYNRTFKFNIPAYLGILLIGYCFIRATTGLFWLSFLPLPILLYLISYFTGEISRNNGFGYLSISFVTASFLLAIYGIAQYADLLPHNEVFKMHGNFDNPAGYASVLALSTPFVLYFTFSETRLIKRMAWVIYSIVFITIVLSGSRAGILSTVIISILYIIRLKRTKLRNYQIWSKIIAVLLLITIISGLYFVKKDSADGRLLAWRCTWNMIKDKPLLGHGYKSFDAEYMLYQARYLEQNPDSKFAFLADNVNHPFNEFLLFIAEFGIVAFLLLVVFVAAYIRECLKNDATEAFILILSSLSILIFSCFSYPLKYPFTWLIIGFCLGSLSSLSNREHKQSQKSIIHILLVALSSIILLGFTVKDFYYEHKWHNIMNNNVYRIISGYENLYPTLNKNPYFLYNFAVRLNSIGNYKKSNEIIIESEKISNDYDVQILKADNYKKQREFYKSKDCYVLASQMCPGRFIPLYELITIYDSINQSDMALQIANKIIDKPVKIPSATISSIKIMMKKRINNDN